MLRPAFFKLVSAVAVIVLLTLAAASAQTSALKYNKSSEVKVKGVIDEIKTASDNTVHITLKNDKGSLDVMLAPEKFLKEMEITFAKGDSVEILGSQMTNEGNSLMLAREVTRNGDVMIMRDDAGKPAWVGWIR